MRRREMMTEAKGLKLRENCIKLKKRNGTGKEIMAKNKT